MKLALLAVLLLAGCTQYQSPAGIETPSFASHTDGQSAGPTHGTEPVNLVPSDTWVYTKQVRTSKGSSETQVNVTFDGWENITRDGIRLSTYRLVSESGAERVTTWYRDADRAVVREDRATTKGSTVVRVVIEYDAPCPMLRFPFGPGSSWTTRCPGYSNVTVTSHGIIMGEGTQVSRITYNGTYQVIGQDSVTVPAGTFQVTRLAFAEKQEGPNQSQAPTSGILSYAEAACGYARTDTESGGVQTSTILTAFRCRAAPQG